MAAVLVEEPPAAATTASSIVTLINSSIGAGILALPYAFACTGWALGLAAVWGVAAVEVRARPARCSARGSRELLAGALFGSVKCACGTLRFLRPRTQGGWRCARALPMRACRALPPRPACCSLKGFTMYTISRYAEATGTSSYGALVSWVKGAPATWVLAPRPPDPPPQVCLPPRADPHAAGSVRQPGHVPRRVPLPVWQLHRLSDDPWR